MAAVTSSKGGAGSLDIGSDEWLEGLTALTQAAGSAAFEQTLFKFMNKLLPVDHCAVFTYGPRAGAGHLFTTSRMDEAASQALAEDYVGGYFERDPNFPKIQALAQGGGEPLRMDRDEAYDASYRQRFFERTELVDKASTIASTAEASVYCNFYRMARSGPYTGDEWQQLGRVLPLITSLIALHYRLNPKSGSDEEASPQSLVHSVINMAAPPFDRLTSRERDVCARILLGFTSEAIALDLGIAATSVVTYRKRAYAKLGIVAQNELFSLCLAAIDRLKA